ncbi:MAG: glycerate kinase, partial [Massilia sp.]|nr:glycerate kinase [Massilia sp.]
SADGGEGTAQVVAARLNGRWHTTPVADANGATVALPFAVCSSAALGEFAIFDVAEIVGLPAAIVPVQTRSTRGVGQAVRAIAALGHTTIVIGLGGSSTNDGGAGMLGELMLRFGDGDGGDIDPVLGTLADIASARRRDDTGWLDQLTLIGLTDVTSPLTGRLGASQVFGRQKGVADLDAADRLLGAFGAQVCELLGEDIAGLPGTGAAGGLGFAVRALGGTLQPGARFILDALGLDDPAVRFDWVITGEGRSDGQTLLGKGPAIVAELARRRGIAVTLLSGAVDDDAALFELFDGCFSVQSAPVTLQQAMDNAGPLLETAAFNLTRLFAQPRISGRSTR